MKRHVLLVLFVFAFGLWVAAQTTPAADLIILNARIWTVDSSQPEAQAPPAQSSTVIRRIQVVDIKDLKPEVRSKVDDIVAHTSDEDIQSLRKSIDATPEAATALKAKGLSSSQVVAINIADGVLTMFAKTA